MSNPERCRMCEGKAVYKTRQHAVHDATELNRKKRDTGRMEAYKGWCGQWHVGRAHIRETRRDRRTSRKPPVARWNWRAWTNRDSRN